MSPILKNTQKKQFLCCHQMGICLSLLSLIMNSLAFQLFGKWFTQPVTGVDFVGFSESALTTYFSESGLKKMGECCFYTETPYADEESDLLLMAKAVEYKNKGIEIDFNAPAYWGNMMTLMYRKDRDR